MSNKYAVVYDTWKNNAVLDKDLICELEEIKDDDKQIEDRFYKELSFGTGGLRGVIGVGTNRMNIYTVAKATQGVANYLKKKYQHPTVAVSYDSRIKSKTFAQTTAEVFAANGIRVYIYKELMPTPCLSYAVRKLKCSSGIMITASHNPAKYNGYKVYGDDGCQITVDTANAIQQEITSTNIFSDVLRSDFVQELNYGIIKYIDDNVEKEFIEEVKKESVLGKNDKVDKSVSIVYSPLNGTGFKPVMRVLRESGYNNIMVVKEQEQPDGLFPTCPFPNPEEPEAMTLGIQYAKECGADMLMATDPDCDRIGIAVRSGEDYKLLSANETGILLLDYICDRRIANATMPENPIAMKTIVTTALAERVAKNYGVKMLNVLTGFKFIGEQIGMLEKDGKKDSFIFGMEESYGYLSGTYVRDKDAVNAAFLICEMFACYKANGISLTDKLEQLYDKYGYTLDRLKSYQFEGKNGLEKMEKIMTYFRNEITGIGDKNVINKFDYSQGIDGLPKSNVLRFELDGNCSVIIRPSGTEPKLKIYFSVCAGDMKSAAGVYEMLCQEIDKTIQKI